MSNGNSGRQRVNLQWFSASRQNYAKLMYATVFFTDFICDNMMLLALNEHLNASLIALATCFTAGVSERIKV